MVLLWRADPIPKRVSQQQNRVSTWEERGRDPLGSLSPYLCRALRALLGFPGLFFAGFRLVAVLLLSRAPAATIAFLVSHLSSPPFCEVGKNVEFDNELVKHFIIYLNNGAKKIRSYLLAVSKPLMRMRTAFSSFSRACSYLFKASRLVPMRSFFTIVPVS